MLKYFLFHCPIKFATQVLNMCRLQLWHRGGRAATGRAGFDYHMGDRSCRPVGGKGSGPSKDGGASYLQALLCRFHVALQLNQRGADQSSPHCLQLPANLRWGKMMNERAHGQETSYFSTSQHVCSKAHQQSPSHSICRHLYRDTA